jgi:hypothetical protein
MGLVINNLSLDGRCHMSLAQTRSEGRSPHRHDDSCCGVFTRQFGESWIVWSADVGGAVLAVRIRKNGNC